MEIKINTIPQSKKDANTDLKIEKTVEDRNRVIAKRFNVSPLDLEVNLFYSNGTLRSKLNATDNHLGIFSGYVDYENAINMSHPLIITPVFKDNLDKQISIMADYTLTKYYMCKVFYPIPQDFKLYYKYLAECLAKITSGNFNKSSIEFDIKQYSEIKKYKKEQEINMVLYIMLEKSGIDFIHGHLKTMIEDCDIKKSVIKIYRKDFNELVKLYQSEMLILAKKLKLVK